MKIDKDQRQALYDFISGLHQHRSRFKWSWLKGHKKLVRQGFEQFCESIDVHRSEEFENVFKQFRVYCIKTSAKWISWSESNISNYIPYIMKDYRMNGYIDHLINGDNESVGQNSNSSDKWGDF